MRVIYVQKNCYLMKIGGFQITLVRGNIFYGWSLTSASCCLLLSSSLSRRSLSEFLFASSIRRRSSAFSKGASIYYIRTWEGVRKWLFLLTLCHENVLYRGVRCFLKAQKHPYVIYKWSLRFADANLLPLV